MCDKGQQNAEIELLFYILQPPCTISSINVIQNVIVIFHTALSAVAHKTLTGYIFKTTEVSKHY